MGWSIKIKTETVDNKPVEMYRFWSGNSDEWVTEWLTREGVIKFLFWHKFYNFVDSVISDAMTFPDKFSEKDKFPVIIRKKEEVAAYRKFIDGASDSDDYEGVVLEKFSEILKAHGLNLSVGDNEGHSFDSQWKILPTEKK